MKGQGNRDRADMYERFWSKVDSSGGADACWPWTAGTTRAGYGKFQLARRWTQVAHRVALLLTRPGREFDDATVHAMHRCDNPPCCNPRHLSWGTALENGRDKSRKGRAARNKNPNFGAANGRTKLTPADKAFIQATSLSNAALSEYLDVTKERVGQIRKEFWACL